MNKDMEKELFSEDDSDQGEDLNETAAHDDNDLDREEEEEEEEDEEEVRNSYIHFQERPKKKTRKLQSARSLFIEDQARVDDEDEDEDDDDAEDGFEYGFRIT
jgi:hypothetical protein